jgi:hypothetical protein
VFDDGLLRPAELVVAEDLTKNLQVGQDSLVLKERVLLAAGATPT